MRVWAKDQRTARALRHPSGANFAEDLSSDWPEDQFTTRRLREGAILDHAPEGKDEKAKKAEKEPAPPKS